MPDIPPRVAARAAHAFTVVGECWESTYSTTPRGYARIGWGVDGRKVYSYAHRAAFVHHAGRQVADDMTVDHVCGNRKCVRPEHLRELTHRENSGRTFGRDWPLGQCRNGHPDSYRRTYGRRSRCLLCKREADRARYRKTKD